MAHEWSHNEAVSRLCEVGIKFDDALALRRIAMTLQRWHELECGDSNDYASWTIARGYKKNGEFTYDDNGEAYEERHIHSENKARYTRIPDRERGALKRLDKIVNKYRPAFGYYVQTDPRGAPLYILPAGVTAENYNRGIAVYR